MGRVPVHRIIILLLVYCTTSHQKGVLTSEYDYEEEYYDDKPQTYNSQDKEQSTNTDPKYPKEVEEKYVTDAPKAIKQSTEETTTEKRFATYEVTELVLDVPDTSTKRVPIVTNFTVVRPLNLADGDRNQISSFNTNIKDEGDEIMNGIFIRDKPSVNINKPDANVKGRNSTLHENKERKLNNNNYNSEDYFNEEIDNGYDEDDFKDVDFKDEPKKSFNNYFHSIRKDIVTKFKSVIDRHKDDDAGDSFHKFVTDPISILSKLHKKTSDIVDKFHKSISKHIDEDYVELV